jgi:hypothetical protein
VNRLEDSAELADISSRCKPEAADKPGTEVRNDVAV